MGRLFNFIFQFVAAVAVIVLLTVALVVVDGLADRGEKADVALVLGHSGGLTAGADPLLDRVVKLYNEGDFSNIIVSASSSNPSNDQPALMAKYLESHGIGSSMIIQNHWEENSPAMARRIAEIMKEHQFRSILIIADYYRMTRMKLVLSHNNILDVGKAHAGQLRKEDAIDIGREVVALYEYVGTTIIFPVAEKVKGEVEVGLDKVKADTDTATNKVKKSVDSLAK
jgi:vancomycin permeability regulator SanA